MIPGQMMNASEPPKLTHHEINNCHDAVFSVLEHRRAQLDALRTGDERVLSDLDQGGDVCCEDEDRNLDFALTEILRYCERCGTRDDTRRPGVSRQALAVRRLSREG